MNKGKTSELLLAGVVGAKGETAFAPSIGRDVPNGAYHPSYF